MQKIRILSCMLFLGFVSFTSVASENKSLSTTISFGIVPQQSATKLARLWSPILAYLSIETGLRIVFGTAKDIPTFEKRLANGAYHVAYMNPYHYTVFHESPGYRAIAKARDKQIRGILVRRKEGDISDIGQLDGSTLAFPAPAAFAASILTRAYLRNQGIEFTPRYVASHDSVYRTVAKGLYPAGGGVIRTLRNMSADISEKLDILWQSPGYTPHAFATHPDLDTAVVNAIQQALIDMEQSDSGGRLLAAIKLKGIEAAADKDWDDVRALNIEQLMRK